MIVHRAIYRVEMEENTTGKMERKCLDTHSASEAVFCRGVDKFESLFVVVVVINVDLFRGLLEVLVNR